MTVTVLGLTGYSGLLPWFYTRLLIDAESTKDSKANLAFAEFLDLFNHRLVSLQYRAWEERRLHVAYERAPLQQRGRHSIADYLLAFLGLDAPSVRNRLQVPDPVLLSSAGLMSALPRSVSGLEQVLQNQFRLPVAVLQFQGRWCQLNPMELSSLGDKTGQNRLGAGVILGRRIWYPQASFRVRVGPLSFREFLAFRPGNGLFGELIDLVDFFTKGTYPDFEVELLLAPDKIPSCRFMPNRFVTAPRLGWMGWLGEKPGKNRANRKTGAPRSVVFRSDNPRALLRRKVESILKGLRNTVRREQNLELRWSEDVVQVYCERFADVSGDSCARTERIRVAVCSQIQRSAATIEDLTGTLVLTATDIE